MSRRRPPSARALAVLTLRDIERREGFSNRILSERLERSPTLSTRDRGLVTTLVYGALRHRARLDWHVNAAARQPKKIKGTLRETLRVAAFELLELERPLRVAASEACKTAGSLQQGGNLRGLITAILAEIERSAGARERELADGDDMVARLQHRWSIPTWIATRWSDALGPKAALTRAEVLSQPPSIDLRVDSHRIQTRDAMEALQAEIPDAHVETVEGFPGSLRVRGGGDLFFGPLHEQGLISVQGLGSQQAAMLLAPRPGQHVLDACAGHGGKTSQLAELMQRQGSITMVEPNEQRVEAQSSAVARSRLDAEGLSITRHHCLLADMPPPARPFDAILVDAPCTGLGDLARHPELRWNRREADLARNVTLQRALLRTATQHLAEDGSLVWSVCSLEPEEGLQLVTGEAEGLGLLVEDTVTLTPEQHGCDGFFAARLRRR